MDSASLVSAYFQSAIYLASDGRRFVPEPWPRDVLDTSLITAQVFIGSGPAPSSPGDSFDVTVYSPRSFMLLGQRPGLGIGSKVDLGRYCFMQAWDQEAFEGEVRRICAAASPGLDWATVAMRVGRRLPWESDYRYDIQAVPGAARSNVEPGPQPVFPAEPRLQVTWRAGWWSDLDYQGCREELLGQVTDGCLGVFLVRWTVEERHHARPVSERMALTEALV